MRVCLCTYVINVQAEERIVELIHWTRRNQHLIGLNSKATQNRQNGNKFRRVRFAVFSSVATSWIFFIQIIESRSLRSRLFGVDVLKQKKRRFSCAHAQRLTYLSIISFVVACFIFVVISISNFFQIYFRILSLFITVLLILIPVLKWAHRIALYGKRFCFCFFVFGFQKRDRDRLRFIYF